MTKNQVSILQECTTLELIKKAQKSIPEGKGAEYYEGMHSTINLILEAINEGATLEKLVMEAAAISIVCIESKESKALSFEPN